jgi:hypothetical protein
MVGCEGGKRSDCPATGETGFIYNSDEANVVVATNQSAYDEWSQAVASNDEGGLKNLFLSGRILLVSARTKVLILDAGPMTIKVRIFSGEYAGKSGILPIEWVHRSWHS